jgi:transposase
MACRSGSRLRETHDNRVARKLLSRLKLGTMLLADRGCDAHWITALATAGGVWANIPPRCNRNEAICFSPHLYHACNLVEHFFNKIKQCRHQLATTSSRPTTSPSSSLHQSGLAAR